MMMFDFTVPKSLNCFSFVPQKNKYYFQRGYHPRKGGLPAFLIKVGSAGEQIPPVLSSPPQRASARSLHSVTAWLTSSGAPNLQGFPNVPSFLGLPPQTPARSLSGCQ